MHSDETDSAVKDLSTATSIAYYMVTQLGMSESFGNVDLHTAYGNLSSETKRKIEEEVRRMLEEGRLRALKVLTERRRDLDVLANALVEYEALTADEIRRVLKGEKLPKMKSLPHAPIKIPEFLKVPQPPLGGSSHGGGGLGGSGGLGESGGLSTPGGPSQPDGSGGAKL